MRFKPPPPDAPEIGWRVEFRPTEVQLTDFENAAYCCFVVLLTRFLKTIYVNFFRVIISYKLTFLLPISKVNENMQRAQRRNAVLKEKFCFRSKLATCNTPADKKECPLENKDPDYEMQEMTVNEIINGL